ncbi:hypothetical protein KKE33_01315 [Patescibacteria group bacterium]|nr:hypothetical protein [Patescibacteria group bacterium]
MRRLWIIIIEMFVFMIGMALIYGCSPLETEHEIGQLIHEDVESPSKKDGIEEREHVSNHTGYRIILGSGIAEKKSPQYPEEEIVEYVTHIIVNAGCEIDPVEIAVAKENGLDSMCERIIMTAAMNNDGDFYEVATPFEWYVQKTDVVNLKCLNGPHDNFCWPIGMKDIFDSSNGYEPKTQVAACVVNECPDSNPDDCEKVICASVTVATVVNLSGEWKLSGATFDEGKLLDIEQSGRSFHDDALSLKHGEIHGALLQFNINDTVYYGTVNPYRNLIQGQAIDLMSMNNIGKWYAERISEI